MKGEGCCCPELKCFYPESGGSKHTAGCLLKDKPLGYGQRDPSRLRKLGGKQFPLKEAFLGPCKVSLLSDLEVTNCAPNQNWPPILNKPIKRAKLKVEGRKEGRLWEGRRREGRRSYERRGE